MVRIPVTLADLESGRIKNSISKLIKHHPDQPARPKRSSVQQTFAQILGYGGYEELRSQAKKNGTAYTSQSFQIEQVILPISERLSRYWGVSVEKAESVATTLGLVHLDAFRPTARPALSPIPRETRASSAEHLAAPPVSPKPLVDAVRLATIMPVVHMAAMQEAMKSVAHMAAMQEAMKPMAHVAAMQEAMKPVAHMAAMQEAMKPMAHVAAMQEAMKPMAHMAAMQEAMKPLAHIAAMQEAMKPVAHIAAMQEAMKPVAHIAAMQEAMKPLAHIAAMQEAMKPLAAIQEAIKPMAHIAEIMGVLKSKRR